MLPEHKFGFTGRKPTVSSSAIKKFHQDKIDKDCANVPLLINNEIQNAQEQQNRKRKADNELFNCSKKNLLSNSESKKNNKDFDPLDSIDPKKCMVYRNWYLLVSIKGYLVVEGNVKGDIKTRSDKIVKRLSNSIVQCSYKNVCILDNSVIQQRDEIPDYVKKKFSNGFPEDWESVLEVWNKYYDSRGRSFFKWPTIDNDTQVPSSNNSISPNSIDIKGCKVLSHWQILINDEGELIIEGTSECGIVTRSKPIIRRLANKKVLSICKWMYILDGTLVNKRSDLPDYVRWKFHNGFPIDWDSVYRHWINYLAKRPKFTSTGLLQ